VSNDERFEQLIAFLGSQLPAPVEQDAGSDGSIIFTAGSPTEVVVHLTEASVIISQYAGIWVSLERFVVKPRRMGLLKWRRMPETPLMSAITALIKAAREARLALYRPCAVCGTIHPPEALFGDDVCPECGEQLLTVH
jgi:hypothetical protein